MKIFILIRTKNWDHEEEATLTGDVAAIAAKLTHAMKMEAHMKNVIMENTMRDGSDKGKMMEGDTHRRNKTCRTIALSFFSKGSTSYGGESHTGWRRPHIDRKHHIRGQIMWIARSVIGIRSTAIPVFARLGIWGSRRVYRSMSVEIAFSGFIWTHKFSNLSIYSTKITSYNRFGCKTACHVRLLIQSAYTYPTTSYRPRTKDYTYLPTKAFTL